MIGMYRISGTGYRPGESGIRWRHYPVKWLIADERHDRFSSKLARACRLLRRRFLPNFMRIKCTVSEWQRPICGKPPPVIFDAPPIWDTFLSAFCLSLRTNSPLDCGEIWHEHVIYFGEDFYQIASESDVPFPSAVDFTANRLSDISGAPSMAGTICNAFNKLLRTNGTLDSRRTLAKFHDNLTYRFRARTDLCTKPTIRYSEHNFHRGVNRS